MRITLDTAILVRTNFKAAGPARELLNVIRHRGARLVLSPFLLAEVNRVLRYPRVQALYPLNVDEIRDHLQLLESLADLVIPGEGRPIVVKDPNDDPVVYTALVGQAEFFALWTATFTIRACYPFALDMAFRS
jgi:putative PIN family toxin of toxin-antitoxin system